MNNPYFSSDIVDKIILNENILPIFKSGKQPQWTDIYATVKGKYGKSFAQRNTLKGELEWFSREIGPADKHPLIERWIELSISKIKKYGADLSRWECIAEYNSGAWRIFLNSNDRKQLNTAIRFMNKVLKVKPTKRLHQKPMGYR